MSHQNSVAMLAVLFVAASVFAATGSANAAELAYDGIDGYSLGALQGQSLGGTGFAAGGVWQRQNVGGGNFTNVVAGGYTYSKNGSTLVTTGSQHVEQQVVNGFVRGRLDLTGGGNFAPFISGGNGLIDQGTVYFSYLAEANGSWSPRGQVNSGDNENGGTEVVIPQDNAIHLIVGKVAFNSGNGGEDVYTYWIDPEPGTSEGANTISGGPSNLAANWSDGFDQWQARGGGFMAWDEVRFGATFEDVTPAVVTPTPEPGSFLLAALGLVALCMRRSRRSR